MKKEPRSESITTTGVLTLAERAVPLYLKRPPVLEIESPAFSRLACNACDRPLKHHLYLSCCHHRICLVCAALAFSPAVGRSGSAKRSKNGVDPLALKVTFPLEGRRAPLGVYPHEVWTPFYEPTLGFRAEKIGLLHSHSRTAPVRGRPSVYISTSESERLHAWPPKWLTSSVRLQFERLFWKSISKKKKKDSDLILKKDALLLARLKCPVCSCFSRLNQHTAQLLASVIPTDDLYSSLKDFVEFNLPTQAVTKAALLPLNCCLCTSATVSVYCKDCGNYFCQSCYQRKHQKPLLHVPDQATRGKHGWQKKIRAPALAPPKLNREFVSPTVARVFQEDPQLGAEPPDADRQTTFPSNVHTFSSNSSSIDLHAPRLETGQTLEEAVECGLPASRVGDWFPRSRQIIEDYQCPHHPEEPVQFFCLDCLTCDCFCGICCLERVHLGHDVAPLADAWRAIAEGKLETSWRMRLTELLGDTSRMERYLLEDWLPSVAKAIEENKSTLEKGLTTTVSALQEHARLIDGIVGEHLQEISSTAEIVTKSIDQHRSQARELAASLSKMGELSTPEVLLSKFYNETHKILTESESFLLRENTALIQEVKGANQKLQNLLESCDTHGEVVEQVVAFLADIINESETGAARAQFLNGSTLSLFSLNSEED